MESSSSDQTNYIKFSLEHFKSIPGYLKIAQVVLVVIALLLAYIISSSYTLLFWYVMNFSFFFTIIWIVIYLLGIRETINWNWVVLELVNTGIITILYAIATVLQLVILSFVIAVLAAILTTAHGATVFFLYLQYKAGSRH